MIRKPFSVATGWTGDTRTIPDVRPTTNDVFGSIEVDYKLFLNIIGSAIFAALFWISRGHGSSHGCEHHARDAHHHHLDNQPNQPEAAGV